MLTSHMAHQAITLFLTFIAFSPCFVTSDIMKLCFPGIAKQDLFPRVKIETCFKSLTSFTLCLWAKPSGRGSALFSYGVPGQDREIYLSLKENIELYVGGSPLLGSYCNGRKPVYWVLGAWKHICVTWTGTYSFIRSFVNGDFCSRTKSENTTYIIPGNGVMVLGQALNGLDTGFHKNESWIGDIAGVQMWDEVLSYEQIVNLRTCKGNLEGNVVSWRNTPKLAFDGIILDNTNVCDILGKRDN